MFERSLREGEVLAPILLAQTLSAIREPQGQSVMINSSLLLLHLRGNNPHLHHVGTGRIPDLGSSYEALKLGIRNIPWTISRRRGWVFQDEARGWYHRGKARQSMQRRRDKAGVRCLCQSVEAVFQDLGLPILQRNDCRCRYSMWCRRPRVNVRVPCRVGDLVE